MFMIDIKRLYSRLLENPNVSPEDKLKIRALLRKPWNPYVVDGHLIAICQIDILIYLEMPHVKRSWKSNLENEKGRNILFPSNTNY